MSFFGRGRLMGLELLALFVTVMMLTFVVVFYKQDRYWRRHRRRDVEYIGHSDAGCEVWLAEETQGEPAESVTDES